MVQTQKAGKREPGLWAGFFFGARSAIKSPGFKDFVEPRTIQRWRCARDYCSTHGTRWLLPTRNDGLSIAAGAVQFCFVSWRTCVPVTALESWGDQDLFDADQTSTPPQTSTTATATHRDKQLDFDRVGGSPLAITVPPPSLRTGRFLCAIRSDLTEAIFLAGLDRLSTNCKGRPAFHGFAGAPNTSLFPINS